MRGVKCGFQSNRDIFLGLPEFWQTQLFSIIFHTCLLFSCPIPWHDCRRVLFQHRVLLKKKITRALDALGATDIEKSSDNFGTLSSMA